MTLHNWYFENFLYMIDRKCGILSRMSRQLEFSKGTGFIQYWRRGSSEEIKIQERGYMGVHKRKLIYFSIYIGWILPWNEEHKNPWHPFRGKSLPDSTQPLSKLIVIVNEMYLILFFTILWIGNSEDNWASVIVSLNPVSVLTLCSAGSKLTLGILAQKDWHISL